MQLIDLMREQSDIQEHLGFLAGIGCGRSVVEFGFRTGRSARAFLLGGATRLRSYDVQPCEPHVSDLRRDPRFQFFQQDSATANMVDGCDVLFIDSAHTLEQTRKELRLAEFVRHAIVLHDTVTFAQQVMPAVIELAGWTEHVRFENCNGLSVLTRT